ncbi:MAG: hypothetical protein ACKVUS_21815 [Saprospiraceae bacterium]
MQFNSKKSSAAASIIAAFGFLLIFSALAGCQKDPIDPSPIEPPVTPPPALEKKILDFYIPFKNVVINEEKRQVIIYETEELEPVTPTIEVSDGVTIQPASGVAVDENQPVTYTLTATDGTTTTYALIICNVEWEYLETRPGGGFSITGMGHFKEPWTAVSKNGILTLHFGRDTESAMDICLNSPVSPALVKQFSVGNYTPANVPAGKAGATFVYRENGVVKTFANPQAGILTITQYDAAKSTISGNFEQVKYAGIGTETQGNTYLSGSFENLPLEIK